MKKTLLVVLSLASFSCSTVSKTDTPKVDDYRKGREFFGMMTKTQMEKVKENFSWDSKDYLIINYQYPSNKCYWDSYGHKQGETRYWKNFYSKVNLENVKNSYVFAPNELKKRDRKILDGNKFFEDNGDFLLKNFFIIEKRDVCFGAIVLNKNGEYRQFNGEYTEKYINEYLKELEK